MRTRSSCGLSIGRGVSSRLSRSWEKGLLLIGPPGIGKTHIAVAVLRQVVSEKRARGLYYDTRSLLDTIRSTYDPVTRTSAVDVLRPVVEAEDGGDRRTGVA